MAINGSCCMARVFEQLQSTEIKPDSLLVSANHPQDQALAEQLGAIWIADQHSNAPQNQNHHQNFQGPLAGIKQLLNYCATKQIDWLLLAPCDAVLLPKQYTNTMLEAINSSVASQSAISATKFNNKLSQFNKPSKAFVVEYRQQIEPLCAAIHIDALPQLNAYWHKGGRSPRQWLQQLPAAMVDFSHSRAIWSVNTPAELDAAEALLAKHN